MINFFYKSNYPSSPEDKLFNVTDSELEEHLSLKKYNNIVRLKIKSSKITKIPNLDKFTRLRKIIIISENLKEIPDLNKLRNLEKLEIYNTKITNFPSLENLPKLERVIVNNCKFLNKIPTIGTCSKLKLLDIKNNNLSDLPDLSSCKKLKTLYTEGNDFDTETGEKILDMVNNLPRLKKSKYTQNLDGSSLMADRGSTRRSSSKSKSSKSKKSSLEVEFGSSPHTSDIKYSPPKYINLTRNAISKTHNFKNGEKNTQIIPFRQKVSTTLKIPKQTKNMVMNAAKNGVGRSIFENILTKKNKNMAVDAAKNGIGRAIFGNITKK